MARKKARTRRPRRRAEPKRKTATRRKTATKRKTTKKAGAKTHQPAAKRRRRATRDLLGPPPAEATLLRDDREVVAARRLSGYTGTGPALSGGDVDADWARAASVGEEAVGGSVATPDQDVVDDLGEALGVPRAPDEPFKPSQEILEARDARRSRQEG